MPYLEGFMTLQKGHMGQQEGVYDILDEVYGTIEGCMTYQQGLLTLQKGHMGHQEALYDLSGGVYGTSKD